MGCIRNDGIAGVEGNRAERVELVLHVAIGLGVFYVGQIHGINSEGPKSAVADCAAVLDALRNGQRPVIPGPRSLVSGEAVFLVFLFLAISLPGNPPAGNFLHIGGIGHVHDHERVAVGALVIFQTQRSSQPQSR